MKVLLGLSLLFLLGSCGVTLEGEGVDDRTGDRGDRNQQKPKNSLISGEWKTECSMSTITRISLKDNSTYERVESYFKNPDCSGPEQEFLSGGDYKLADQIEGNIYGLNLKPDENTETLYYSIKIDKSFIQISAGHSSSPDVRVLNFQDKDKMYKVKN